MFAIFALIALASAKVVSLNNKIFNDIVGKNEAVFVKFFAQWCPHCQDLAPKYRKFAKLAEQQQKGEKATVAQKTEKPIQVAYGINNVTRLIERKAVKLVVIAHDVEPLEMVVFIPYLCRKLNIPFCIGKGKARLGQLIHKKTAAVLAVTDVKKEDSAAFTALVDNVKSLYFENHHMYREFGGRIHGYKHNQQLKKVESKLAKEAADKKKQQAALVGGQE